MIRPASNSDEQQIKELIFGVLIDYGLSPDPERTDFDLLNIEHHYAGSGGCFEVLENDDREIIGTVGIYPMTAGLCELRKMYLSPKEKGKGLGKILLEHALAKAAELGFNRVMLETASVLTEAIGLYKKYGFVSYQSDHLSARCDQAYIKYMDANKPNSGNSYPLRG